MQKISMKDLWSTDFDVALTDATTGNGLGNYEFSLTRLSNALTG
jgi:hypothetical protein